MNWPAILQTFSSVIAYLLRAFGISTTTYHVRISAGFRRASSCTIIRGKASELTTHRNLPSPYDPSDHVSCPYLCRPSPPIRLLWSTLHIEQHPRACFLYWDTRLAQAWLILHGLLDARFTACLWYLLGKDCHYAYLSQSHVLKIGFRDPSNGYSS